MRVAKRLALRWCASVLCGGALLAAPAMARPASAQDPAPQQAAPQAPPDQMVFNVDQMLVVFQIAETHAAEFEAVVGKVKEVLNKSEKPERKQQAAHWKVLKIEAAQNGLLTYFFFIDQVVKGSTYDPFKILAEGLPPEEVRALYDKVSPGLKGISMAPLGRIINMGGEGMGGS